MSNAGEITVQLKMESKQYYAAAAAAQASGKELGRNLDREVGAAAARVQGRFDDFAGVAKKALLATGVAAGVAGAASVKMAGDFQQSLNVLQSVTGATAAQMGALAAKARELGKDASLPGVSARDAAAAMTELAKAGVSVNDVMAASKGVLSLAKAGNLDVAQAATIAARALNAFGLSGDKATQVADVLAAGANASSADVTDMALALSQAGSSASRMGVSLGDTVTALGLFSNAGINGSDAGTSLKTALQRLAAPTDEAAGAMKELGLNFFDAKGNFIGLEKTAGQLQAKLSKLTQEQREQALAAIFGSDASRAAGVLAAEGAAGFEKMSKAVNKSGAASDLAAAQNSGFNGALDNLKSTLETIGTDLGTKLLPPLTDFLKVLADNAVPAVELMTKNSTALAAAIVTLGAAYVAIKTANFVGDIAKAGGLMKVLGDSSTVTGAKLIANAAKSGAAWVIEAVKAGAAWTVNFATMVAKGIATGVSMAAQAVVAGLQWVAQAVLAGAAWVAQFIAIQAKAVWAGIQLQSPALAAGLTWVAQAVAAGAAWVLNFAKMVAGGIASAATMAASGIAAAATWIAQPVVAAAAWAAAKVTMLADMAKAAGGSVIQAVKAGAAWVTSAVTAAAAWALNVIKMLPYFIGIAIGSVANAAIASAAWVASAVAAAAAWLIANIVILGVIGLIIAAVVGLAYLIIRNWDTIKNAAAAAWNFIKNAVAGVIAWVTANWPLLLAILTGPIGLAVLFFVKNFDTIKQVASNVMNAIAGFFVNGFNNIKNVIGGVIDFVRGIPGQIAGAFGNFGSLLYNKGRDLIQGLINGAGSLLSSIGKFFLDKVPAFIREPFKKALGIASPSKVFAGYGKNIVQGLAGGIKTTSSIAVDAAKTLGNTVAGIGSGLGADLNGSIGVDGAGSRGGTINQTNIVNTQVEFDLVTRELAWRMGR